MSDADALASYLQEILDLSVTDVSFLTKKLNAVFRVSTAGGDDLVVRSPARLRDAPYIVDLADEYEILSLLADTPVPAPRPIHHCSDPSVLGEPFVVLTYVDGDTVPLGGDLPARFRTPTARRQFAEGLIDTLAEIHTVDPEPFQTVCRQVTPDDQIASFRDRLAAATEATGDQYARLLELCDWLDSQRPADTRVTLTHGDYRPSNVVLTGTETPAVAGVIDWETAALGDPRTDLGYLLLRWRDPNDSTPSLDWLSADDVDEATQAELRRVNERGLCSFTGDPGSPSRAELVARYESRTGIEFEAGRFFRVLAAVGLATVWADIERHAAESGESAGQRPWIEYVGRLAECIADGDG